jgi:predicted nucleotidyltransferase component of viral defense system
VTEPRVAELGRREALLARMRNVARDVTGDEPVRRVNLTVAMDRFLVRLLATTSWGTWVLMGGYANQLRYPGEARFTEDVDLRIDADIDTATGMIAAAIAHGLDDPFAYELPAPPRQLPGPPGGGLRFVVVARVAGGELVRFKVDVSAQDVITGELERHPSDPIVERLGFEPAWFPVYPVAQQLAEKLHAYTLPRDVENTRAKDLVDMVWLTTRHAFTSDALIEAAKATFARRASHSWPPVPGEPPPAWTRQYTALRKEMALEPATPREAHDVLMAFLEPVLAGTRGLRWDPATRSWRASRRRSGSSRSRS